MTTRKNDDMELQIEELKQELAEKEFELEEEREWKSSSR
jgi:hypothetical protein